MKEYLQLQKLNFGFIMLILLIQLSGCVSYRIISSLDLPDPGQYNYTIYCQNSKFPLVNTVISNDILSGKVDFKQSYRKNSIHVYLSSDTVIKINTENMLSIPLNRISIVEKAERGLGKNPSIHKEKKPKTPFTKAVIGLAYCSLVFIVLGIWPLLNK